MLLKQRGLNPRRSNLELMACVSADVFIDIHVFYSFAVLYSIESDDEQHRVSGTMATEKLQ